jgi:hypothetical protein
LRYSSIIFSVKSKEKNKTSYNTEILFKKLHDELANDVFAMAFAETQDLSTSQNKKYYLTT